MKHSVEKIGGTSMSRFSTVLDNVIIGQRRPQDYYNRIFVVSAYAGITNLLLEHKKTGEAGVYSEFINSNTNWEVALDNVLYKMKEINKGLKEIGLDTVKADEFIEKRISEVKNCLNDINELSSYGHFTRDEFKSTVREILSSIGEAHSAYNSTLILCNRGINAQLVDLTGWKTEQKLTLENVIKNAFSNINFSKVLPVVTGYAKCSEGLMSLYDRGYSEITFSKIASVTKASEAIIHKEYHLSSADPSLIAVERVKIIGQTNYDVADQLADLGMEAIHPKATKELKQHKIPVIVKNVFDPEHKGTIITVNDFNRAEAKPEMICGNKNLVAIEVWDPDMIWQHGYDYSLLSSFEKYGISYISKIASANTITHFVSASASKLEECISNIRETFKSAQIEVKNVSVVSVIGRNLNAPGLISKAASALSGSGINVLACSVSMRQVNIQFVVSQDNYMRSLDVLHKAMIENNNLI